MTAALTSIHYGPILPRIVRQYAGARSLAYMARRVRTDTGQPCTTTTIEHAIWHYHAAPTRHQQWLTAHQAAGLLGCSPQWVSHLCRSGKIVAHRNPSSRFKRGCWLILPRALESYAFRTTRTHTAVNGEYYLTPHATRRFVERVRPDCAYDAARTLLIGIFAQEWPRTPLPKAHNGETHAGYMLHVNHLGDNGQRTIFRAVVSYKDCNRVQFLPGVVTIL